MSRLFVSRTRAPAASKNHPLARSRLARPRRKPASLSKLQLWTAGSCDGVLILSGEERKILRSLTQLAASGNVRTQTLQAFDAKELKAITG